MFRVYNKPCKNCLLSDDRIVSKDRTESVVKDCINSNTHFICHKSSLGDNANGDQVCCKRFYDKYGDRIGKIGVFKAFNLIKFVELPDDDKLPSHKTMNSPE